MGATGTAKPHQVARLDPPFVSREAIPCPGAWEARRWHPLHRSLSGSWVWSPISWRKSKTQNLTSIHESPPGLSCTANRRPKRRPDIIAPTTVSTPALSRRKSCERRYPASYRGQHCRAALRNALTSELCLPHMGSAPGQSAVFIRHTPAAALRPWTPLRRMPADEIVPAARVCGTCHFID